MLTVLNIYLPVIRQPSLSVRRAVKVGGDACKKNSREQLLPPDELGKKLKQTLTIR